MYHLAGHFTKKKRSFEFLNFYIQIQNESVYEITKVLIISIYYGNKYFLPY